MAFITKLITVDVARENTFQSIIAKQYDTNSRFLKVTLTNEGEQIFISPTSTVTVNALREDNSAKSFLGTVNKDGTVTVPLTNWMIELDGTVKCDISVIDSEQRKLTSTSFTINVEAASCSETDIIGDENYDILVSLIGKISDIQVPDGITQENGILHLTANGENVGEGAHLPFWKEVLEKPDTTLVYDIAKADPIVFCQRTGKKLGIVGGKTYQVEVIIDGNEPVFVESTAIDGLEDAGFECAVLEINNPIPDSDGNIETYAYVYDGVEIDYENGSLIKAEECVYLAEAQKAILIIHDLPETVTTVHKIPAEYLPTDEILNAESIIENIVIDMPFFENQPTYSGASFTFSPDDFFYITAADASAGTFKLSYDRNGSSLVSDSTFSLPALDTGNCGVLEDGYKVQLSGDNSNFKMRLLGEYGTAYGTLNKAIPKKSGYDICEFDIEALACADISSGKFNSEGSENVGGIAALPNMINDVMKLTSYSVDTWDNQQNSGVEIALRGVSDRPARTYLIHSKGTIDFSNDRVIVSGKTASAGMIQDTSGSVTNTYPHIYDKQVWMYPEQSDYNIKKLVNTVVIGGAFLNGTKIKLTWRKKHE